MTRWLPIVFVAALSAPAACEHRDLPNGADHPVLQSDAKTYPVIAVAERADEWGTVKGQIVWGGKKLPTLNPIAIKEDNQNKNDCLKANNGKPPPDESYVVNPKNKGLKDVFVWLVNADPKDKKPLPIHPSLKEITVKEVVIDQPACHFIPHAIALREGQKLVVKNSATFAHNFKWDGEKDTKNEGGKTLLPAGGSMTLDLVASPKLVGVQCGVHPWMNGSIRVFGHPYFAVTDEDGKFEFKNAPAGNYRLMIWQREAGWKGGAAGRNGEPITIPADLKTIAFPPPPDE